MNEPSLDASADDRPMETAASPGSRHPARPSRVWTVFVVYALAFAAMIGVQVVLTIALLLWLIQQGVSLQEAPNRLLVVARTPEFFIAVGLPGQLILLLTALAADRRLAGRSQRAIPGGNRCGHVVGESRSAGPRRGAAL